MPESLNLQQLATDLADAGSPWEMDPGTSMAQLTEDERRIRLGFQPPAGEMSFTQAVAKADAQEPLTEHEIQSEISSAPAKFDLRNVGGKNFTTPVKNQGGCGSCVAFGSAAVMETTFKRLRNAPNLPVDLSEAHIFYCHGAEENRHCGNGWWPDNAFKKAKAKGVTFEAYFPYTAGNQACTLQSGAQENLLTPTGHTKLGSRAKIKEWIATKGSVTGCFVVYQDFFSYKSGVYKHVSGSAAGGHCVEIIGYDDSQGCWICKNSWGTNWGESGYFRIGYGVGNIDSWAGPYGVNGVRSKQWVKQAKVNGLWSNSSSKNAWVHLSGVGWRKLATTSSTVQHTMLAQMAAAKAANRNVNVLEENKKIRELYVI